MELTGTELPQITETFPIPFLKHVTLCFLCLLLARRSYNFTLSRDCVSARAVSCSLTH